MSVMPDVLLEVGFTSGPTTGDYLHLDDTSRGLLDTAELAGDDIVTDITEFCRGEFNTTRGSSRVQGPVVRYEAGTASAPLNNEDGRFDPTNLAGPYVSAGISQVAAMRMVRFRATWAGVTYNLWRGFSDDFVVSYDKSLRNSDVVLTATDGFKVLANNDRAASAPAGAGEDSGARVSRILDSASWPSADRVIAEGDTTLQATTLAAASLTELFLVADTEIGEFYIDGAGRAVFRNRLAAMEETRSNTSQATFGTDVDGGELPYDDVVVTGDADQLVNLARIARNGGSQQTAEDLDSQVRYLISTHERTDLLMETDAVAADYAAFLVFQCSEPEVRFTELRIKPRRSPDLLFPQVLGREIGDRITVIMRPPWGGTIERDCFIRGITHDVTLMDWTTTFQLQSATRYAFITLDSAVLGTLDENALAF